MKKLIALVLVLSLVLCGCGKPSAPETTAPATEAPTEVPTTAVPTEAPTEAPTEVPTEAPTEAPTEPQVYTNPLNGQTLDAPIGTRNFAVTINNIPGAMPMYGVSKADLFFEMFINDHATRGLAIFSDISQVSAIGSVRSLRYNFTDLAETFDAVVLHAGGSNQVMSDLARANVDDLYLESDIGDYYFRDQNRLSAGYNWEHCLFAKGAEAMTYAENAGIRVTPRENADYGLRFTEDGTPADGEAAAKITVSLIHDGTTKKTIMEYDEAQGAYQFHQYGKAVYDDAEDQYIYFENVIVLLCRVYNESVYHVAELPGSGEGYFACGGKIIPIKWSLDSLEGPLVLTLADGTQLELGVGSSYVAIAPLASTVKYE